MNFAPKHVVAMVGCVCAAVVLAPVGVMAATGQLVNITDPVHASQKARVSAAGALQVSSRAGVTTGALRSSVDNVADLSLHPVFEVAAPNRLALTEFTAATRGTDNGYTTQVDLRAYVRTSGTNACGGAGWQSTLLRRISVKTNETVQLLFNGPPLVLPPADAGQRVCLTASISQLPNGVVADFGAVGYRYQ